MLPENYLLHQSQKYTIALVIFRNLVLNNQKTVRRFLLLRSDDCCKNSRHIVLYRLYRNQDCVRHRRFYKFDENGWHRLQTDNRELNLVHHQTIDR